MKVYLDYAATTPVRSEVIEAMRPYWSEKFGNPSSIHSWGREARQAVEEAREKIAELICAEPEEILFTSSITTANNLGIMGSVRPKSHLITSAIEHHSVLDVFKQLEKQGYPVSYLPVDKNGLVLLDKLDKLVRPETALVSVMWANNEVGTIEPIEEVRVRVKSKSEKILIHTDGATVAEYLSINVKELGVDLLSLAPHKFGGPKGVGILYVKKGTKIASITFGGHQEDSLWPGTEATPLIVGTARALEIANSKEQIAKSKITNLRDRLIKGVLRKIPETMLTGHPTQRLPDIASFVFKGVEGEAILLRLDAEGIAASSGSACTSGELKPSHVLLAMGISPEIAHGSIRFSLGKQTTEEEIDYVLEKLPKVIADIRAISKGL